MSEVLTHISVPFPAEQLKRGDYIRLDVRYGTEDVRVMGVKKFLADGNYLRPRIRINVEHADGRKTSQWLSGQCNESYLAYKVIQIPTLTAGESVAHTTVPDGAFAEDETGDIAYRWGGVGVWVCLSSKWTARPWMYDWATEAHRQWKRMLPTT